MPAVFARVVMVSALAIFMFAAFPNPALRVTPAVPASTPTPDLCRTEPRAYDELQALFATPVVPAPRPTPGVLPDGEPADPETVAGITTTVHELVACWNAGALLRAYDLYTDGYLRRLLARQGPPGRAAYAFFATPDAVTDDEPTVIVAVERVRLLDDGRVGATVVLRYPTVPNDK